MLGKVIKYNKERGFGFIRNLETNETYFCHVSQIDDGVLERGYIVNFQGKYNAEKDKTYAANVQVVES